MPATTFWLMALSSASRMRSGLRDTRDRIAAGSGSGGGGDAVLRLGRRVANSALK